MKLGVSNIAWKRENTFEALSILKNNNIKYIDIAPTAISPDITRFDYDFVEDIIVDGFELSGMQSLLYPFPNISLFDGHQNRNTLIDYLKKIFEIAQKLKITNLVFGSPKNRLIRENRLVSETEKIDIFQQISYEAKKFGCIICLEPNPVEYNCNFITNTYDAVNFIRNVGSENFRLNLDVSTTILCNEDIDSILRDNFDLVNHIHISSPHIKGILDLDHKKIFETINRHNYQGFLIMETLFPHDDSLKEFEKNVKCFSTAYR